MADNGSIMTESGAVVGDTILHLKYKVKEQAELILALQAELEKRDEAVFKLVDRAIDMGNDMHIPIEDYDEALALLDGKGA